MRPIFRNTCATLSAAVFTLSGFHNQAFAKEFKPVSQSYSPSPVTHVQEKQAKGTSQREIKPKTITFPLVNAPDKSDCTGGKTQSWIKPIRKNNVSLQVVLICSDLFHKIVVSSSEKLIGGCSVNASSYKLVGSNTQKAFYTIGRSLGLISPVQGFELVSTEGGFNAVHRTNSIYFRATQLNNFANTHIFTVPQKRSLMPERTVLPGQVKAVYLPQKLQVDCKVK
ncbi:MAG: hypothetical protein QNJ31_01255 [Candidatus Caenarcaniphilales bacterium]|nr:hypothetical protein [Candidatus Caenarcaniphilales bacterium]